MIAASREIGSADLNAQPDFGSEPVAVRLGKASKGLRSFVVGQVDHWSADGNGSASSNEHSSTTLRTTFLGTIATTF
jgi:hypothetical protein